VYFVEILRRANQQNMPLAEARVSCHVLSTFIVACAVAKVGFHFSILDVFYMFFKFVPKLI
jgi:hypothetical protein